MVNTRSNTHRLMTTIEEKNNNKKDPMTNSVGSEAISRVRLAPVFTVRNTSNISRRSSTGLLNTHSPEPMITRSKSALNLQQSKRVEFTVNIDFDKASHEWRRNKKNEGNGSFTYKRSSLFVENKV